MNFADIRERVKGWKTVIYHSLYGVPATVLVALDLLKEIDITPIMVKVGVEVADVPFYLACIAVGGIALRIWGTTGAVGTKE